MNFGVTGCRNVKITYIKRSILLSRETQKVLECQLETWYRDLYGASPDAFRFRGQPFRSWLIFITDKDINFEFMMANHLGQLYELIEFEAAETYR